MCHTTRAQKILTIIWWIKKTVTFQKHGRLPASKEILTCTFQPALNNHACTVAWPMLNRITVFCRSMGPDPEMICITSSFSVSLTEIERAREGERERDFFTHLFLRNSRPIYLIGSSFSRCHHLLNPIRDLLVTRRSNWMGSMTRFSGFTFLSHVQILNYYAPL
jgi:hypothetical protein